MINEKKHQNRFRGIVVQPYDLFVRISPYRFPWSIVCVFYLSISINSTHHAYYDVPSLDIGQLCIEPIFLKKFEADLAVLF